MCKILTCIKCAKNFNGQIEFNGKIRYVYSRKLCFDCSPYLGKKSNSSYFRWKRENKKSSWCSGCKKELPLENFYLKKSKEGNNRPQSLCKICNNKRSRERSSSFKEWAVDYKGGSCIRCGYTRCLDALQFHHRDPSQKDIDISKIKLWSKENVKKELDKCDIVCGNCHSEIHYELRTGIMLENKNES